MRERLKRCYICLSMSYNIYHSIYTLHFTFWHSYKHALDGLIRVIQQEGLHKLFSGCSTATMRASLMTIGQLSFYDQIKTTLLRSNYFKDNPSTHVLSSVFAVSPQILKPKYFEFIFFHLKQNYLIFIWANRVLLQQHLRNL